MKDNGIQQQSSKDASQAISAETALQDITTLKEPKIINGLLLWLEQRPFESGRTTALIRPWFSPESSPQEITPGPVNIRTKLHGYGGGAFAIQSKADQIFTTWIDSNNGCLWGRAWLKNNINTSANDQQFLNPISPSVCLSIEGNQSLGDGFIDIHRNIWIGVMEKSGEDYLVSYSIKEKNQEPKIILKPDDFIGYPSMSPNGDQLTWIEWKKPSMPWEESNLWWARLDDLGEIVEKKLLRLPTLIENQVSFFQPIWLANDKIVVAEDSNRWWNLRTFQLEAKSKSYSSFILTSSTESEVGMPQWVAGMSTQSIIANNKIATLKCKEGNWSINLLSKNGSEIIVDQPFDNISGLYAFENKIVALASDPVNETGLLEIDMDLRKWKHEPVRSPVLGKKKISSPEPFWFQGFGGERTHSWFYPPLSSNEELCPLLVRVHSGPTAMASSGLNLTVQYWTARGWAVVDVNYGGSTGFGRSYRERLNKGWGQVDVFDCEAVAKALVAQGKVHQDLIAIEGGSAGGFTALGCLSNSKIFRVGACRYAVSDLFAMAAETHRFEAGYLETLVGKLPQQRKLFRERSPLFNSHQISAPVIFFQGLKDNVVLPSQTEMMAKSLRERSIPVEIYEYEEEGHGFRDLKVKTDVLKATERFFRKHLAI